MDMGLLVGGPGTQPVYLHLASGTAVVHRWAGFAPCAAERGSCGSCGYTGVEG